MQNPDQTLTSLDAMITRMQTLKRKLQILHEEEQIIQAHSQKRIKHLQDLYEIPSLADVKYDEWSRVRLDRLMVDYLLRAGYSKSAARLAKEKVIEDLVDLDVFMQCQKVADSLERGETKDALMWCTENRTALKKIGQNNLEFELRLQQYIEMIRTGGPGKQFEAILHAKKFLVPFKDTHNEAIFHAAGLLAQPPNTSHDPYKVRLQTSDATRKHTDHIAGDVLIRPMDLSLEPVHHNPPHTPFPTNPTPPTYRSKCRPLRSQDACLPFPIRLLVLQPTLNRF
jgi:macrophage erythroblast attacher